VIDYLRTGGFMKDFGTITLRVGDLARRNNWSASDLARKTGLSRQTCYKLIKGKIKRIEFNTLARLVCVFGSQVGNILWYIAPDDLGSHEIG